MKLETSIKYWWSKIMADEKKIDIKDRNKRFTYTESDVKSIFNYGPTEKNTKKLEKKIN